MMAKAYFTSYKLPIVITRGNNVYALPLPKFQSVCWQCTLVVAPCLPVTVLHWKIMSCGPAADHAVCSAGMAQGSSQRR